MCSSDLIYPIEIFQKILIIGHNAPFVSVEIVQFAPRCLGATVFRNEMVKKEMTHRKLG